jgi:hypothetical protein
MQVTQTQAYNTNKQAAVRAAAVGQKALAAFPFKGIAQFLADRTRFSTE